MQQAVYSGQKESCLFQVSYYEKRINFEVFHALTDGTGSHAFSAGTGKQLSEDALIPRHDLPSLPVREDEHPAQARSGGR